MENVSASKAIGAGLLPLRLIYAYLLFPILAGRPWLRGTEWGLILWFLAQVVVMPMMGMGFFSANAPQPFMSITGSQIGHIVYGAIWAPWLECRLRV